MKNKTLIIGASLNPERYSYKAAAKLLENGHDIYMLGNKAGTLFDREIVKEQTSCADVDTVTMYVSAKNQVSYYDYIISLQPRRVIFNPGTENTAFAENLNSHGIKTEESCTLVLLATNSY
ncbi:CoA-binding protein [Labilibaculum filiforme]|uniref:CoA-binding protein n=1 Tax=Labilibaculum filiforme TaxID=1940526 RepID=A0A2N3HZC3_9BACT|nr:CoA-binding protein [Labilibaculum filiforme]PKQ63402.1 CoA-binding protein [Labilibaculum filiforme]